MREYLLLYLFAMNKRRKSARSRNKVKELYLKKIILNIPHIFSNSEHLTNSELICKGEYR